MIVLILAMMGPRHPDLPSPRRDADGFQVHEVRSEYQPGPTTVRVLLPTGPAEEGERFPVVYVLPVEAADGRLYGDGLEEAKRNGLHDRHRAIFVAPTFRQLPWYADHPTDPAVRQESHFIRAIVPFIERAYPARAEASGRLLLGFSKSGWGAFSLLMRRPDLFGKAAAWDAPLMMDRPGLYGSGPVFGDAENFGRYRLTGLLERRGPALGPTVRLIHLDGGNFQKEHEAFDRLMAERGVARDYVRGPKREHRWESGWLPVAVESLFRSGPRQTR